ncbi:MAG: nuclear transport factor 2 family protein [Pseudomonadales bacterium]
MSTENDIHALIQTYFDCMFEASADKTHAAFHPSARITGYMQGKFSEMTVEQFADVVAGVDPSPKARGDTPRLDIVSLDVAGDTAVARVRDDYMGLTFLDTLSLVRVEDRWQIYNKLYHVEGEAG